MLLKAKSALQNCLILKERSQLAFPISGCIYQSGTYKYYYSPLMNGSSYHGQLPIGGEIRDMESGNFSCMTSNYSHWSWSGDGHTQMEKSHSDITALLLGSNVDPKIDFTLQD